MNLWGEDRVPVIANPPASVMQYGLLQMWI